jgi:2-beta-glucuronyltransferase
MESTLKIILISYHYIEEKRKAGFQFIASSLAQKNHSITFVTAPVAYYYLIGKDYRKEYPIVSERKKIIRKEKNISSYVLMTAFTPENAGNFFPFKYFPRISRLINYLTIPIFYFYGKHIPKNLREIVQNADIIFFESTPAIMYFGKMSSVNPHAKMVYRVSDDLELFNCHPIVIKYEKKIKDKFDLVSVPSHSLLEKFSDVSAAKLHYHGIDKELFAQNYPKPQEYKDFKKNVIFVGNSNLDSNFIHIAAGLFGDWGFHVIGPFEKIPSHENVIFYGEMNFADTVPYIKNADIGLQILKVDKNIKSFSDSLKIIQYTWCNLPIIAPFGLDSKRNNIFYYQPAELDSIKKSMLDAANFDRNSVDKSEILSWNEMTDEILKSINALEK